MEKQAERVAELDEVLCYFAGLRILIETGEEHLGELQSRNTNYATANSKSAIGFKKKGFVYLKMMWPFKKWYLIFGAMEKSLSLVSQNCERS